MGWQVVWNTWFSRRGVNMNKRKAKKLRKKQDMFVTSFASSYREVREHDRAYHEFVVADKRRCKEECFDSGDFFFDEV